MRLLIWEKNDRVGKDLVRRAQGLKDFDIVHARTLGEARRGAKDVDVVAMEHSVDDEDISDVRELVKASKGRDVLVLYRQGTDEMLCRILSAGAMNVVRIHDAARDFLSIVQAARATLYTRKLQQAG